MMFKNKIPLRCTLSGHYHIPITKPLPDKSNFKHILFIKEISSKNKSEKIKIAAKLHRQFLPMVRKTGVQSQIESAQRLKKMVLDAALLNTQHYKVRIKGKVEQSRDRSCALPYTSV